MNGSTPTSRRRSNRRTAAIAVAGASLVLAAPAARAQIPPDPRTQDAPAASHATIAPGLVRVLRLEAPSEPTGRPTVVPAPPATGFDWTDTGLAAGSAGAVAALAGGALLVARRERRPVDVGIAG